MHVRGNISSARRLDGVFGKFLDKLLGTVGRHADEAATPAARHADDVVGAGGRGARPVRGAQTAPRGRRPPHQADVTVVRDGRPVPDARGNTSRRVTSGNQTPEEAAQGFPRNSLDSHTENRAMRDPYHYDDAPPPPARPGDPLPAGVRPGDSIVIDGRYPACSSCKGRMNDMAERGVTVVYRTPDGKIWVAGRRGTPLPPNL